MKLVVKITEKHIKEGVRNDCEKCVVAMAIRDALNEQYPSFSDYRISTGRRVTMLWDDKETGLNYFKGVHPKHISQLITHFDMGCFLITPTTFEIEFENVFQ